MLKGKKSFIFHLDYNIEVTFYLLISLKLLIISNLHKTNAAFFADFQPIKILAKLDILIFLALCWIQWVIKFEFPTYEANLFYPRLALL